MRRLDAREFVKRAGITALASAAVLAAPLALRGGSSAVAWGLIGWSVMSVLGVAGGAWMTRCHGTPGNDFMLALGSCMLARLLLGASGAFAAAAVGTQATYAYLIGLAAGYFPLLAIEMNWFLRRDRRNPAVTTVIPGRGHQTC